MKRIGFCLSAVLAVMLFLAVSFAFGQEVVERLPQGTINWTQGLVTAKGSGAPPSGITLTSQARLMAERAARADALRNLLEAVKGVRVDSETTVETYTTKSDRVMTRVSGIVIGARVVETKYMSDGAVEITMAINLTGELLAVMLQEVPPPSRPVMRVPGPPPKTAPAPAPEKRPLPETKGPPAPAPPPAAPPKEKKEPPPPPAPAKGIKEPEVPATPVKLPPPPAPAVKTAKAPEPLTTPAKPPEAPLRAQEDVDLTKLRYTGLIIDARKLGLRPALVPKILNEKGELVYSAQSVEQQELIRMGLVGYAKDVNAAARNQRVTAEPYVVPGLNATGEKKTDVVISDRDARIVLTTAPYTGYLKNGRVMVVYD